MKDEPFLVLRTFGEAVLAFATVVAWANSAQSSFALTGWLMPPPPIAEVIVDGILLAVFSGLYLWRRARNNRLLGASERF